LDHVFISKSPSDLNRGGSGIFLQGGKRGEAKKFSRAPDWLKLNSLLLFFKKENPQNFLRLKERRK
jgi:hypothetical protein